MYYVIVVCLMFVFPLLSIAFDIATLGWVVSFLLLGKWYVFWAVGIRLATAGLSQIARPRYTAQTILGIQGEDALLLVRELGFANVALGCVGIVSVFSASWVWVAAGALGGGVFYLLAGINHVLKKGARTRLENVAMGTDLFAALVLLGWLASIMLL